MGLYDSSDNKLTVDLYNISDRENLINTVVGALSNEDSNGNNGSEYACEGMSQYFGLKDDNYDTTIYNTDAYAKSRANDMKDKSDVEVLEFLMKLYKHDWRYWADIEYNYILTDNKVTAVAIAMYDIR